MKLPISPACSTVLHIVGSGAAGVVVTLLLS